MIGTIICHYPDRKFGFIVGDEDRIERFFHGGSVPPTDPVQFLDMENGDRVSFVPTMYSHKGKLKPRAANVQLFAKVGDYRPEEPVEDPDHPELTNGGQ